MSRFVVPLMRLEKIQLHKPNSLRRQKASYAYILILYLSLSVLNKFVRAP